MKIKLNPSSKTREIETVDHPTKILASLKYQDF
jgi:hypothetical protein